MSSINEIYRMLEDIMAIDSPIGYTKKIESYVCDFLKNLGYEPQMCKVGGVYCDICEGDGEHLILTAHTDTLGAMVKEISGSGRLGITALGGLNANNIECENCKVYTRDNKVYTGTVQLKNASLHVNKSYNETKRDFDSVEFLRQISEENLDLAVFYALKFSIENLARKKAPIHIDTINAYNFLAMEIFERK